MAFYIRPAGLHYDRGRCDGGVYEYTKTVTLEKDDSFTICAFAAGRYKLFINEKYICEGPCRSAQDVRFFDKVTVNLHKGENKIRAVVFHVVETTAFTTGFIFSKPEFLFEARSESAVFGTDESWKCEFIKNHLLIDLDSFIFPREDVSGDRICVPLQIEKGDAFDFTTPRTLPYGWAPFRLREREIAMIAPAEEITFTEVRRGKNFIEYDAGKYVTANVSFSFKAGCDAKITYAECYVFDDGKRNRGDTSGRIEGIYDKVSSGSCDFTFDSFWYRAFRYIRIETETPEKVVSAKGYIYHYPITYDGSFTCSDENFNKMQEISINTLLCCTTELFVDCPYYEQQQYDMDSAIEAAVYMRLTADRKLVKKCIYDFAASQQPCGLLCANYPCTMTQIIPGFSLFWIWLLHDYLEATADAQYVRTHIGTVDKILNYFDNNLTQDGLVTTSREWDFVDWVPGWERGNAPVADGKPHTIYSLYLACALKNAAHIASVCSRPHLASEYTERYNSLCSAINEKLYDKNKQMYHDGEGTFSMHTIMWAVLSGIVSGEEAKKMAQKLDLDDIYKSSYSMNFFLFRALEKAGCYDMAANYFGGWQKMIELGCTTWCENPDDPRSECHAWSCAPLYEFSANVLGVKYSLDNEIVIAPNTMGLEYASGNVPTRFGIVKVDWKTDGEKFNINISSPEGVAKKLILPNGQLQVFTDGKKSFETDI